MGRRSRRHAPRQCDAAWAVHDLSSACARRRGGRADRDPGLGRRHHLDPDFCAGDRRPADRRGRAAILVAIPPLAGAAVRLSFALVGWVSLTVSQVLLLVLWRLLRNTDIVVKLWRAH